jgi:hypothetical protein
MRNTRSNLVGISFTLVAFALAAGCAADSSKSDGAGGAGASTGGTGAFGSGGSSSGGTSSGGSSSGGTSSGGTSGTGTGGASGDPCEACVESTCAAQLTACDDDPGCAALLDCLDQCNDEACGNACFTANPGAGPLLEAIDTCAEQQCASTCGDGGDACETCAMSKCGPQIDACDADPSCQQLLTCLEQCPEDEACWDGCYTSNPAGASLLDAEDACVEAGCATECAY